MIMILWQIRKNQFLETYVVVVNWQTVKQNLFVIFVWHKFMLFSFHGSFRIESFFTPLVKQTLKKNKFK